MGLSPQTAVIHSPRVAPPVVDRFRQNGILARQPFQPGLKQSRHAIVNLIASDSAAIANISKRNIATTKTFSMYPLLHVALQKLTGNQANFLAIGGANFQSMKGSSSRSNTGNLLGTEAGHLNFGAAKCGGANLLNSLSRYFNEHADACLVAPQLCHLIDMGIALEAQVAIQPASINQADALIETELRNHFLYMSAFTGSSSIKSLIYAPQIVLNTHAQLFSNDTMSAIVRGLLERMQLGAIRQQRQDPSDRSLLDFDEDSRGKPVLLFNGEPTEYFTALLESGVLRQSMSELNRAVSPVCQYVSDVTEEVLDEIESITER